MKTFRLQTVLNVRKVEEEKLQGELANLIKSVEEAERKLNYLRFQKSQSQRMLHERQSKGLKASEIALYNDYLNDLSKQIADQRKLLRELNLAKDGKREKLIEASKKRKIIEKLKEKALLETLSEERQRHQNFIDEMGIARHVRKWGAKAKEM